MLQRHCEICGDEIPRADVFLLIHLLAVVADPTDDLDEIGPAYEVCGSCINDDDDKSKLLLATAVDVLAEWDIAHQEKPTDG